MTVYTSLNKKGRRYVKAQLQTLGLDWEPVAVFSEIEARCTDVAEGEDPRDYEVRQNTFIEMHREHFNTITVS